MTVDGSRYLPRIHSLNTYLLFIYNEKLESLPAISCAFYSDCISTSLLHPRARTIFIVRPQHTVNYARSRHNVVEYLNETDIVVRYSTNPINSHY
jgi:hypothetical protein